MSGQTQVLGVDNSSILALPIYHGVLVLEFDHPILTGGQRSEPHEYQQSGLRPTRFSNPLILNYLSYRTIFRLLLIIVKTNLFLSL